MSKKIGSMVIHYTDSSELSFTAGALGTKAFRQLNDLLVRITELTEIADREQVEGEASE